VLTFVVAAAVILSLAAIILQIVILRRLSPGQTDTFGPELDRVERALRDELGRVRGDTATDSRAIREVLDRRLRELFDSIGGRLEQVHRDLGEMQSLAAGVGDLKRIMSGVRARGIWGELQLRTLLDELLTPDQYERNVAVTGTNERVEFAIRLPGTEPGSIVYLPIDSKFPLEDYERLIDCTDPVHAEECARRLERRVRDSARDIRNKYISVPRTTEFAILYLPSESLYAEVLRRPGLIDDLQRTFRVTLAGPTTLAAFLNSLRLGFRTIAIQQRSSEVWQLLGEVRTEFNKYSDVLARVQKKLQEAVNIVETGLTRTRVLERRLEGAHQPGTNDPLGPDEPEHPLFSGR
jgi:DNA recombination protein RmuC